MKLAPDSSLGVPLCDVLVHGSGECEQLGLGEGVLERKKPTLVKSLIDKNIVAVATGSLHNLALSAEGRVYSWGCNDDGALGRTGEENIPLEVDYLAPVRIKKIAVGDCHSAFLDVSGKLWLCGTYKDSSGHLGFPDFTKGIGHVHHKQIYPVIVAGLPPRTRVEDVVCGANHTVITLSSTDKRKSASAKSPSGGASAAAMRVMTFGNDEFGQLGLGKRSDEEAEDETTTVMLKHTSRGKRYAKIKLFPRDIAWTSRTSIAGIFATAQTSFIKTSDGSIYGCGLNNFGQLGLGTTSVYPVKTFTKVEPLSETQSSIEIISGGTVHCAALTADGRVLTWGRRDYSGSPPDSASDGDIQPPKTLSSIPHITHLACGGSHTLAVSKKGDVYAWGFGGTHQLGNLPRDISMGAAGPDEEPQDELEPYLIQSKQLGERFIVAVASGAQHSVELAFNGKYAEPVATDTPSQRKSYGNPAKRRKILV